MNDMFTNGISREIAMFANIDQEYFSLEPSLSTARARFPTWTSVVTKAQAISTFVAELRTAGGKVSEEQKSGRGEGT